jgi:hypothetical protein
MELSITNGFRVKTMYVYYIVMKIYVFGCMNIFSFFYCLYITIIPHHSPPMTFTWTISKPFKTKIFIPFTILFNKTSHSNNNLFLSRWKRFQRSQTLTYILTKRKLNKKFLKVYTSNGPPCDLTCIIKCKHFHMTFTWLSYKLICKIQTLWLN